MFKDKNVLITGGKGMVGRALAKMIEKESPRYLTIADLPEYDLRDRRDLYFNNRSISTSRLFQRR